MNIISIVLSLNFNISPNAGLSPSLWGWKMICVVLYKTDVHSTRARTFSLTMDIRDNAHMRKNKETNKEINKNKTKTKQQPNKRTNNNNNKKMVKN